MSEHEFPHMLREITLSMHINKYARCKEMPDYEIIDSELKSIKESQYKGVKLQEILKNIGSQV